MKHLPASTFPRRLSRELAGCLAAIARKDRDLEKQLQRAAQSILLNLAEGNCRRGKDRLHFFRIAAGSAAEVLAGLDIALAWGCLSEPEAEPARQLLDRLLAMCWRLTEQGGTIKRQSTGIDHPQSLARVGLAQG